ncbi:MAG: hypothetical protein JSS30_00710 [Verrucomicrobia bacterium]|nr:hypothetical protein [Verrucomicrobiota bacterium]
MIGKLLNMKNAQGKLKQITHLAVLTSGIPFFVFPESAFTQTNYRTQTIASTKLQQNFKEKARYHLVSYDETLNLLEEIESGQAEKKYHEKDLKKINEYLVYLAEQGMLPEFYGTLALNCDIKDLLSDELEYEFALGNEDVYSILPAVNQDQMGIFLCKSKISKKWKKTKKFLKKHKKVIIIGAVVVVAVAAVVIAVMAVPASAAAAGAGAAGTVAAMASKDNQVQSNNEVDERPNLPPIEINFNEAPFFKAELDSQVFSFKERLHAEESFQIPQFSQMHENLSWEETGRILGPLFAHESVLEFQCKTSNDHRLSEEIRSIRFENSLLPVENGFINSEINHQEIDRVFSTDYAIFFSDPSKEVDLNVISHHLLGEQALRSGYYKQAVKDLGKVIEMNPSAPIPFLKRGMAYFGLGQYELSIEDYKQFASQSQRKNIDPLSVYEFSLGFAKGLPRGVYESGEGLILFMVDFVKHPINTSGQIIDSFSTLVDLVHKDEWGFVAEALSPEIYQLVTEWDALTTDKKGELSGYAIGKHGADILAPGAIAKVASKSLKSAQELAAVCKNLQIAQETLVLETAAGIENTVKIAEIIQNKTLAMAEKLGFNAHEIAQLENIGKIEGSVSNIAKSIPNATKDINFANHALQRAVERGISRESILDALASPLKIEEVKIDKLGRPSQRFIGQKAEVVINPETQQVVSVNPTSTKKFEKLNNEINNVKNRVK